MGRGTGATLAISCGQIAQKFEPWRVCGLPSTSSRARFLVCWSIAALHSPWPTASGWISTDASRRSENAKKQIQMRLRTPVSHSFSTRNYFQGGMKTGWFWSRIACGTFGYERWSCTHVDGSPEGRSKRLQMLPKSLSTLSPFMKPVSASSCTRNSRWETVPEPCTFSKASERN